MVIQSDSQTDESRKFLKDIEEENRGRVFVFSSSGATNQQLPVKTIPLELKTEKLESFIRRNERINELMQYFTERTPGSSYATDNVNVV